MIDEHADTTTFARFTGEGEGEGEGEGAGAFLSMIIGRLQWSGGRYGIVRLRCVCHRLKA